METNKRGVIMSVVDLFTGKANKDAKAEKEATQKELRDSIRLAREAIDKALIEKERKAAAGKE